MAIRDGGGAPVRPGPDALAFPYLARASGAVCTRQRRWHKGSRGHQRRCRAVARTTSNTRTSHHFARDPA
jgi:hypothetical protein